MEIFSALLALWAGNSPVTGEFPAQRPVTRGFDVSFDLRLNKWFSKISWGCWFDVPCNFTEWHTSGTSQVLNFVAHYFGLVQLQPIPSMTYYPWWRHQMETFSVLLALCERNSPVPTGFPSQRPVTRSFDAFFDLCLNKRLRKQPIRRWFETPSCSLWRHCNFTT